MPEYRRFIAYFYEYIDGKRQKNVGFVKAEQKNGEWKMQLQLKGRQWPEEGNEIYGYYVEEDGYPVTLIAKGYGKKEELRQNIELKANWKAEDGKSFGQLNGMWIPCGERRCFLSHWIDGDAEVEKLGKKKLEKAEKEEKEETIEKAEKTEITEREEGRLKAAGQEAEELSERRLEPHECLEDMKKVLRSANSEEELAGEETGQTLQEKLWQQMWSSHLKISPFPECDCIVICPKDILWMHRQGWQVGRNTFLMQGFSNYHHLLLGRKMTGEYILGVPGKKYAQSEADAKIFGYTAFYEAEQKISQTLFIENAGNKNEQFGYWCKTI